ncbi:low molecular weight phosphatase family protein [Pseudactinotalea suaedae]|uniref:arsenate-mycothiol transferase ArsC n=1 Tax=Pseudactinotalea suaedae TaxID=1524924 RepID=UPI0012E169BA|nr:low molecular weight phosphatase family protein [Pseudactinotalea suaedae]
MSEAPIGSVLFVCARNGGKSVMAAALAARQAPGLGVRSAGTDPGSTVNALSAEVMREVGLDISGHQPLPVTDALAASVDLIVILGSEAQLETASTTPVIRWETDEPSTRGIDGIERMRLVRDDIAAHVEDLLRGNGGYAVADS